jgi:malate dehydrogenase (oxaloacetate-decarboxylating)
LVKKQPKDIKVLVNGGGAAGLSITKLLLKIGVESIIVCDTKGAIYKGRKEGMNDQKE